MAGSLNMARDSHKSRALQQQHNGCPSISKQVACQKLLITSRAPVTVPFLSYTVQPIENSRIPPHTSAQKHGTRKDISGLCNEGEHLEPYDVTENSVQLIAHTKWQYEHRKLLANLKNSSVTNHQLYEHSQSLITP
jgi:hypothetical protein